METSAGGLSAATAHGLARSILAEAHAPQAPAAGDVAAMRMALTRAAEQFYAYAVHHAGKGTQEGDEKAKVNAELAGLCKAVLGRNGTAKPGHYVVNGPGRSIEVTDVVEYAIGTAGELIMKGADGGTAACFARGAWFYFTAIDGEG